MSYANSIAKEDLSFGLSLMSYLGEGNISISPISVRITLAMLYEGARGATAGQIAKVAALPEDVVARREGFRELANILNEANVPYALRCANGMWLDKKYSINDGLRKVLADYYKAESWSANFEGNPERERSKINEWVSKRTEEKISELFPAGSINTSTIFILANALYFKAPWDERFDPQHTQKQKFTLSSGESIEVDMMRKGEIDFCKQLPTFPYGQFDGVQVVALPYKGCRLAKMIMLPPKNSSVKSLEADLKDDRINLADLYKMLRKENFAQLEIPKHEIGGNYNLKAPLKAMGIDRIFTLDAELDIGSKLYVDECVHKTYFKTDEEGSEGAASTGIVVTTTALRPSIKFVADRPFLEAVIDTKSGAIIFLNRIEDPR